MMPPKQGRSDTDRRPFEGYIRVSRVGDRAGESYISPTLQERAIRSWAASKKIGVEVRAPEENVSGAQMDRPIFNEVMGRIRRGESRGIVVYKLDRLARTLVGGYSTLSELAELDAEFASATEPEFDFVSPQGRMFLGLQLLLAEYFRELTKESWAASARSAVERGVHVAPYGAFGYDRGSDGRLQPNEFAPLVAEAFRLRADEQWTWQAIANWLEAQGAELANERRWTANAVQRLCRRRVYLGEAFWSLHQNQDGREPSVNRDAHPPIVSQEHFDGAQMDAANRFGGTGNARPDTPEPLLGGLIRCAGCRYTMSQGWAKDRLRIYRCRGKYAGGRCPAPSTVKAEAVEDYVEAAIRAELADRRTRYQAVPTDADLGDANGAVDEARADLDGFRRDTKARRRLGAAWSDWLDEYLKALRSAEQHRDEITSRLEQSAEGMTVDLYDQLDRPARRSVIAGFVDVVFLRRSSGGRGRHAPPVSERALILWAGQGPTDLPKRRRFGGPIRSFPWAEGKVEPGSPVA